MVFGISSFLSILVCLFSIGTVKVMHFSVFSRKEVNCFSNSSANSFVTKWFSISILYFKLQMLCAATLYVPVHFLSLTCLSSIFSS